MKNYPEVPTLTWGEDKESIEDVMAFSGPAPEVNHSPSLVSLGWERRGGGGGGGGGGGTCTCVVSTESTASTGHLLVDSSTQKQSLCTWRR